MFFLQITGQSGNRMVWIDIHIPGEQRKENIAEPPQVTTCFWCTSNVERTPKDSSTAEKRSLVTGPFSVLRILRACLFVALGGDMQGPRIHFIHLPKNTSPLLSRGWTKDLHTLSKKTIKCISSITSHQLQWLPPALHLHPTPMDLYKDESEWPLLLETKPRKLFPPKENENKEPTTSMLALCGWVLYFCCSWVS